MCENDELSVLPSCGDDAFVRLGADRSFMARALSMEHAVGDAHPGVAWSGVALVPLQTTYLHLYTFRSVTLGR